MSLRITAYSNLKPVGKHVDSGQCPEKDHVVAFCHQTFTQSFRGIPVLSIDHDNGYTFLNGGCFEVTDQTQRFSFHAGTHGQPGTYSVWREHLAKQFNPYVLPHRGIQDWEEPEPDLPFYELLWFANNEGSIGPEAAADLLVDYRQCKGVYKPMGGWDPFDDWGRAFELAADNGLIHFH